MFQVFEYYNRFQTVRGGVTGLPGWGRFLIAIAAIPGAVLISLSIVAFVVSLAALLLLTVPVYRLVRFLSSGGQGRPEAESVYSHEDVVVTQAPRRQIDVKIVE